MIRVALLTIGDGRDDLFRDTMQSFWQAVGHDAGWLEAPEFLAIHVHVDDREHTLGFCGAIQEGWRRLRELDCAWTHVFHLEEDFRFDRPFDLAAMIRVLDARPRLAQIALRRGPVNDHERAIGADITDAWPDEYTEAVYLGINLVRYPFLEHRLNWTTNPCVYRRSLVETHTWPSAPRCEEAFGNKLIGAGYSFAYWGGKGQPWITHTGHERTGRGY